MDASPHDRAQTVSDRNERTFRTEAVRRAAFAAVQRAGAAFAPGAASISAAAAASRTTVAAVAREGRDAPYAGAAAAAATAVAAGAGVLLAQPALHSTTRSTPEHGAALPDYSDKYELLWGGGGPDGMPSALLTKLNEEMAKRGVIPVEIGQLGPDGDALGSILA